VSTKGLCGVGILENVPRNEEGLPDLPGREVSDRAFRFQYALRAKTAFGMIYLSLFSFSFLILIAAPNVLAQRPAVCLSKFGNLFA